MRLIPHSQRCNTEKMMLLFLLLLGNMVESQFNLYDTHQTIDNNSLKFDCLRVYFREIRFSVSNFYYMYSVATEYCRRPLDMSTLSADDTLSRYDRNFTFEELHQLNVTIHQLLNWSVPIDLVEQYQDYLNQLLTSSASSEIFFNCTEPWFGSRCQYSYVLETVTTPYKALRDIFGGKLNTPNPHLITNLTCYIHLKCDRGGPYVCLDWREICDGRIDCLDGGLDELHCFDLEVNECGENEFRCYNGICIGEEFRQSGDVGIICPNQPSPLSIDSDGGFCLYDPLPGCEDSLCTPSNPFSCGDGQCVDDFNACRNGRHHLLIQSINAQGNLSYDCWIAMSCLTKITDRIDETLCKNFSAPSDLIARIQSCQPLTQFPTIPVLLGHVRFLYNTTVVSQLEIELSSPPDYVCYDEQLCDFLIPTFRDGNYTCRHGYQMGFGQSMKHYSWSSIIYSVKPYFRGCLTGHENNSGILHPSLYACKNSSKRISKHRIIDNISDCYANDDEEQFKLSCSLNQTHRFNCSNENKCPSPVFSQDACATNNRNNLEDIEFQDVCDRTDQLLSDKQNHTDETECDNWPCNTIYTRCNSFPNCPDGEDEENCTASICNPPSQLCVDPYDYAVTCLSTNRVGDKRVDCLGAPDEPDLCRDRYSESQSDRQFWCRNTTTCVPLRYLCDRDKDCPLNDDEAFCGNRTHICSNNQSSYQNSVDDALCRIGQRKIYFSLKTSSPYPLSKSKTIDHTNEQPVMDYSIASDDKSEPVDYTWIWRCNRGLYVRFLLANGTESYRCFCPPAYYGDWCQYQNQRVLLKLVFSLPDQYSIYITVATLIDDDERQEINSYEQFITVGGQLCGEIFDVYLLYSSRPKNSSKNYSVRLHAFEKRSLAYIASWYFRIPFPFLPVSRLAAIIDVPSDRTPALNNCPLQCQNGECMKYINSQHFFCHCQTGWSGVQCHIPMNCSACSYGSHCVGQMDDRPICVCPSNRFGPRCLLTESCPTDYCQNNGQCVTVDPSVNEERYVCICSEQFEGLQCETPKTKLEIHLIGMEIPAYVLAYIITVYEDRQPTQKMMLRRLLTYQHAVTFYMRWKSHLVFVKIQSSYYLAVLQEFPQFDVSTSVSPAQRCRPISELLNSTIMTWPRIRQVKYYHIPCQKQVDLVCFYDESYMCLCTLERHANCFKFDHNPVLTCHAKTRCLNGAECLQDDQTCPRDTLCICTDCYFGDRCQFYAKGIGLTLDDILRNQIRPNTKLADQPASVKASVALTMIMFVAGLINSVLCLMTFRDRDSRQVGCSMYLLASSITSLLTMIMFAIKFWFVILTQINPFVSRSVFHGGCVSIEPLLKLMLYTDNWLNACVAVERAVTVFKGISFNQSKSKRIARWTILFLPAFIMGTIIHEPLDRGLFDDREEQRIWCVTNYSHSVQIYNTFILFFHFLVPFSCNLFSALFIIVSAARHRAKARTQKSYRHHLREQFNEHKQLVISPLILVVLSVPRLIISLLSGCVKSSRSPWLYLSGYFISFIPSVIVFIAFVLPSALYKRQFQESLNKWRQRFHRE